MRPISRWHDISMIRDIESNVMKANIKTAVLLKAIDLRLMNLLKEDLRIQRAKSVQKKAA
jgi:hypothetical protein